MDEIEIRKAVREGYAKLAKKSSCCSNESLSRDNTDVPFEAQAVSAGCGNPVAIAELKEGQTVLDLGSGGGIDVFLASQKVGLLGKAIGVDATPEMIWRARETAKRNNITNVEFLLGEIERLPIESEMVDVIISNCVINLSPDKKRVFSEAFRVLKSGGKLAVSDIVLLEELPDAVKNHIPSWVGCLVGAALEEDYLRQIRQAGFVDVNVVARHIYEKGDIKAMIQAEGEKLKGLTDTIAQNLLAIKAASSDVVARKP